MSGIDFDHLMSQWDGDALLVLEDTQPLGAQARGVSRGRGGPGSRRGAVLTHSPFRATAPW
jgi:hypothetical protein